MAGLLIPGIGVAYNKVLQQISNYPIFLDLCRRANLGDRYRSVTFDKNEVIPWISDTLDNQKLSYVINCAMSDIYHDHGISFHAVVGYSMGIYAAL